MKYRDAGKSSAGPKNRFKKFKSGHNAFYIAFTAVFLAVSLIPLVCIPLSHPDFSLEKRMPAPFPELTNTGGSININFLPQLGSWFTDHFAFRQDMVTAQARAKTGLLGESPQESVISGTNGWLYYGETLNDYMEKGTMSERQIFNAAHTVRLMQEQCETDGQKFVFAVAPNKNSLYPDNMPKMYKKSGSPKNWDRLVPVLKEEGVCWCDLMNTFRSTKEVLYHKTDSHWNNKGALLAYNKILDTAGIQHNDFKNIPCSVSHSAFSGDLETMLYPKDIRREDEFLYALPNTFRYVNGQKPDDMNIETACPNGAGTLVIYRDSFGNTLFPFLAQSFKTTVLRKAVPYDMTLPQKKHANAVVLEIVERNLPNLQKKAPRMQAPEREFEKPVTGNKAGTSTAVLNHMAKGDWMNFTGEIKNPAETDKNTSVYIRFVSGGKSKVFEAFPQTAEDGNAFGYSLYIHPQTLPGNQGTAETIGIKNGNLVSMAKCSYCADCA